MLRELPDRYKAVKLGILLAADEYLWVCAVGRRREGGFWQQKLELSILWII